MLIQQLKELEKDGIITRTVFRQVPPRVEYELSGMGIALGPAMAELIDWAFMRRETMGEPTVTSEKTSAPQL
jgi:DNA-binding HxlR family transcriptional regulator